MHLDKRINCRIFYSGWLAMVTSRRLRLLAEKEVCGSVQNGTEDEALSDSDTFTMTNLLAFNLVLCQHQN